MDFQKVIYENVEKNIHFTTDISIFTLGNEKKTIANQILQTIVGQVNFLAGN